MSKSSTMRTMMIKLIFVTYTLSVVTKVKEMGKSYTPNQMLSLSGSNVTTKLAKSQNTSKEYTNTNNHLEENLNVSNDSSEQSSNS